MSGPHLKPVPSASPGVGLKHLQCFKVFFMSKCASRVERAALADGNSQGIHHFHENHYFCCCSVTKLYCSTPGFPVLHCFPEFAEIHVHWVSDAIQPSHTLSPTSPPALNLSQHQGLFQWLGSSSYQVARVLELQLQHQSFQWVSRVSFLLCHRH